MNNNVNPVLIHTLQQLSAPLKAGHINRSIQIIKCFGRQVDALITEPFRADHFTILVVKKGEIAINVNLMKFKVGTHHVLVLSPHLVRQCLSISADADITAVAFNSKHLESAGIHLKDINAYEFFSSQLNPLFLTLEKQEFDEFYKLLDILEFKLYNDNGRLYQEQVAMKIFGGFIYDLSSLIKEKKVIEGIRSTRKEQLASEFIKLLHENFRKLRSTKAYAELLHVTPKYLSETLKKLSGKTAGKYIEEIVTIEAKILLQNSPLNIGEIANSLNFNDQFIFSRYFKKQSGLSPSQYRETA
jgi:AraC family transcriptional activator of pobA